MRRRAVIAGLAGAAAAWPLAAFAQQAGRLRRIAILSGASLSAPGNLPLRTAFVNALGERGWIEGRNIAIENFATEGRAERFPELAAEIVAANVDLIVAPNSQAVSAAREKTQTIPIVMLDVSHPVEAGFVASLARPGGNITGLTNQLKDIAEKHHELLLEVTPGLNRMAVLYTPSNAGSALGIKAQEALAKQLGTTSLPVPVDSVADIETAFAMIARERPQALQIHPTPLIGTHRARIAALAIEHRLPTVTAFKTFVRDGVLLSYGPDQAESWRRVGAYADRILRGANPADLPVEQPTKFELHVNLRTARALGLTIPPTLLARADEVIE